MEFIRPILLIVIYHGIRPPLNRMVNTKNHAKKVLALNAFTSLDNGYAVSTMISHVHNKSKSDPFCGNAEGIQEFLLYEAQNS